ncbi:hypothetical protein HY949_04105 [Candidatus Gottesmanbacteria bacterium]|nr:hypothetical protein [Candidatus Gottesmanbacteria bacterium]
MNIVPTTPTEARITTSAKFSSYSWEKIYQIFRDLEETNLLLVVFNHALPALSTGNLPRLTNSQRNEVTLPAISCRPPTTLDA